MHSDLDATRRLGELKSEFVESPPIKISQIHDVERDTTRNQERQSITKIQKALDTGKWDTQDKDIQPYKKCMEEISSNKTNMC